MVCVAVAFLLLVLPGCAKFVTSSNSSAILPIAYQNDPGAIESSSPSSQVRYLDPPTDPSSDETILPILSKGELESILGEEAGDRRSGSILSRVLSDHRNFYSGENLTLLAGGFAVGGLMANTNIDHSLQSHLQSSLKRANSDEWLENFHASKQLGNGIYTLPVFAATWGLGATFPDSKVAEQGGLWGERSIRGFLIGAPAVIGMQALIGGSRPGENDHRSHWTPLHDQNGVSGHAFMGSLPFITAAKMTDSIGMKGILYLGSSLAPLSRVNDNAHYPSQVALGWWMSYLAATAVASTDNPDAQWHFYPWSNGDQSGMLAEFRF